MPRPADARIMRAPNFPAMFAVASFEPPSTISTSRMSVWAAKHAGNTSAAFKVGMITDSVEDGLAVTGDSRSLRGIPLDTPHIVREPANERKHRASRWLTTTYPAQHESLAKSFLKACAASLRPSTVVK